MTAQSSPKSGLGAVQGEESCDVVIIGSGIGGLCCAALCAMYGMDVIGEDRHHYHYRYAEITESWKFWVRFFFSDPRPPTRVNFEFGQFFFLGPL